jgi:hypothetical protein
MDTREAAIRARQVITEQSEGSVNLSIPRLVALVPTCLENWTRGCFVHREKRELLKKQFTVSLVDGIADLTDYLDGTSGRINLQELVQTTIYRETDTPYTWLASSAQLYNDRPRSADAPACYLDGRRLLTRFEDDGDLILNDDAQIMFTVTQFPADVTEIPKTLEQDFVLALASLAMGGGGSNV